MTQLQRNTMEEKTRNHPCFHCGATEMARIHLPVAPGCNIQCNYCVRKFDCTNESRPGVVSRVLTPKEALKRFRGAKNAVRNLTVVGIAGPGDPLANFQEVKETLRLIRQEMPDITFCLSTNGLMLPFYASHLISLGVSHVTVTVNAVSEETAAGIYSNINYLGRTYTGREGAGILLNNQLMGIQYLSSMGVVVKVNVVVIKGVNDHELKAIVERVREYGADITNFIKMIPVKGSAFEDLETISSMELNKLRYQLQEVLPQMFHCRQCRADAIGTLDNDISLELTGRRAL